MLSSLGRAEDKHFTTENTVAPGGWCCTCCCWCNNSIFSF